MEQAANGRPMIRAGQGARVGISDLTSPVQVESRRKGRVERTHAPKKESTEQAICSSSEDLARQSTTGRRAQRTQKEEKKERN